MIGMLERRYARSFAFAAQTPDRFVAPHRRYLAKINPCGNEKTIGTHPPTMHALWVLRAALQPFAQAGKMTARPKQLAPEKER
jgi:hypothetical protein